MDQQTRSALAALNSFLAAYDWPALSRWPPDGGVLMHFAIKARYPSARDIRLVAGEARFWGPGGLHVGSISPVLSAALFD